jgi:hypothetical protein
MTLNEEIEHLEFQLTLEHKEPKTKERLELALECLRTARNRWKEPGKQAAAMRAEETAHKILKGLLDP